MVFGAVQRGCIARSKCRGDFVHGLIGSPGPPPQSETAGANADAPSLAVSRHGICREPQPLPGDSRESPNIVPIDPTIWYTIRIVRAGSTFDEHCHGTVNHIEVDHAVPDLHGAHISTT